MFVFTVLLVAALGWAEEPPILKSQKEKLSYIIGVDIGRNLKGNQINYCEPNQFNEEDLLSKRDCHFLRY
jgi:hypothetical protein